MPGVRLLTTLLVLGAVALAGCGGDDEKSSSAAQTTGATGTESTQNGGTGSAGTTEAAEAGAAESADLDKKPVVSKGSGDPPSELVVKDIVAGKGKRAKAGDTVGVQYVGVLFDSGKEFDASWRGDQPGQELEFPLGEGRVIPGWDQGLVGMRVGGRRRLVIPAELAYGAQGFPPAIPPNAALIFDVDLKNVTR
jgi:peptidylprolyl isomerase